MKKTLLRLLDIFWALLPHRLKVHFIENDHTFGYLDAPNHKIKMKLTSVSSLGRLTSCAKEPKTIKWIDEKIGKDQVLFDIGANVGAYSLYAARAKGAKVYAFEPSPSTFQLLLENIQLNGLSDSIIPINAPLSSSTDMKEFRYSSLSAGAASHAGLEAALAEDQAITQPIFSITMNDLLEKYHFQMPDHIKIDVDGHELDILKGASKVLESKQLNSVQIELSSADANYNKILSILESFKFKIESIGDHPGTTNTDIIFVR